MCVVFGFCGSATEAPFDSSRLSWTADDFAREVLRAEGIGPLETDYFKVIRREFTDRFGASVSVQDFDGDEAARRLAMLGGVDPKAAAPRRRRRTRN
jgi:hypothetical protein